MTFAEYHPGEIPAKPGVYVFRDRFGNVIYVGKASNLRRRLNLRRGLKLRSGLNVGRGLKLRSGLKLWLGLKLRSGLKLRLGLFLRGWRLWCCKQLPRRRRNTKLLLTVRTNHGLSHPLQKNINIFVAI